MADSMALLPMPPPSRRPQRRWDVDFARYFAMPLRSPAAAPPPGLRPLPPGKLRRPGTWLPAAGPAVLSISTPAASAAAVLSVSLADVVFEEHLVSSLTFSWPQVSCVTQCPIRGSRVMFMSFCDKSKQIQKFAVRFGQVSDAEEFLNCVKLSSARVLMPAAMGCLSNSIWNCNDVLTIPSLAKKTYTECSIDTMDIVSSGSEDVCGDSSTSEYIASNGLHHRFDDASSFEEPGSDYRTKAPALSYHDVPEEPVFEPLLANNIDTIFSGFPPSFTEMLTNYSTDSEKEQPSPVIKTEHASHQEAHAVDSSSGGNAGKETSFVEADLMNRIKRYMADDSFHDMLFKLEKVIDELGGDLAL